jgi:cephalosporin hydroxylase
MKKNNNFESEKKLIIKKIKNDKKFHSITEQWFIKSCKHKYSYLFTWMGQPIIQYPQDIIAMQEIIWKTKPNLIIETGIAHGGSLIFYSSMLELLGEDGKVIGIDIDIRSHNRAAIEQHPMAKRIIMIEGSSTDHQIVDKVHSYVNNNSRVLVSLDSHHTHEHVLSELELYSPLVTKGSYLVVFDTVIEDLPHGFFPDREWNKKNNPGTAVKEFLKHNTRFIIDKELENKLVITVAPNGFLKCIKE